MSLSQAFPAREFLGSTAVKERAAEALRLPMGATSPLWAMYAAAAGVGVAYWWMTSWTRLVNVEALAGFAPKLSPAEPMTDTGPETALLDLAAESAPAMLEAPADVVAEPAPALPEMAPEPEPAVVEAAAEFVAAPAQIAETAIESAHETVATLAETTVPALQAQADDLTRMTGVGPKLAAALAARGVTSFAQIAAWSADDLAEADAALALKGRAMREAWVAQAKRLAGAE